MPVIGFLSSRSANNSALQDAAFRRALNEAGYVDGRNVVIDYRWANGQYDRLPEMAADLVARRVAVIFRWRPGGARGEGGDERRFQSSTYRVKTRSILGSSRALIDPEATSRV